MVRPMSLSSNAAGTLRGHQERGCTVIKIGIVDDEREARERLRQEIARFEAEERTQFEVLEFDSAASFLSEEGQSCDVLFLDIDMPQMTGMELAEKIRETDSGVIIIFCTNLQQFALNGYSVSALGFIVKPVEWYSFHLFLSRAVKALEARESLLENGKARRIFVKDGAVSRFIHVSAIKYVEVRRHYLHYNIREEETGQESVIRTRGSMQDAADQLSQYGFARCNVSFLVNMNSITAVSNMNVYIGQTVLPIGRTYKDSFMREFSRFMAKRGR